jgi:hypothetical protein
MKTSRSEKDPLLPPELVILLVIIIIAVLAGLLLDPITVLLNYFKK